MMKIAFLYLLLLQSFLINAQGIDNNLLGQFKTHDKTQMYSKFEFDNNGKTIIADMGIGDYFIKNDSLFIFPDKDLFIFKIEKNKLIGISDWVKNGEWVKTEKTIQDQRNDSFLALKNANLLNEYYLKTRVNVDPMDFLIDSVLRNNYYNTIEELCSKGLLKACKENFAIKLMEEMGGIQAALNAEKAKPLLENPKMISLANDIIKLDEAEGHSMLALYYFAIKQTEKANTETEKTLEKRKLTGGF